MNLSIASTIDLKGGVKMPRLGLGTWQSANGEEAYWAVRDAIEVGYRHIDTAAIYGNEESVGRAVRESKLPREQIFVTTKLWNEDVRQGRFHEAIEASLKRLDLGYIDLYLIHWPVKGKFASAYRALEQMLEHKKTRAIGVSNFLAHHLDELSQSQSVMPAVNQIEWHPWLQSRELVDRCQRDGIAVEAWAPIMKGKVNEVPTLVEIARQVGKTPAQVTLRWGLQRNVIMIPKSVKRQRIEENAALFDFELTDGQMRAIDALDRDHRLGAHPDTFTF